STLLPQYEANSLSAPSGLNLYIISTLVLGLPSDLWYSIVCLTSFTRPVRSRLSRSVSAFCPMAVAGAASNRAVQRRDRADLANTRRASRASGHLKSAGSC